MDVSSTAGIVSVATTMASNKISNDKEVAVLNKALDAQVNMAAGMIETMGLASTQVVQANERVSDTLGTKVDVFA